MSAAQTLIGQTGRGIVIYLDEGKGNGHLALMASIEHKKAGFAADAGSF